MEPRIKEDHLLLRDLRANLLALDESVFNSDHHPDNIVVMNYDYMTEKQHAVRRLWRIRRFLRQQVGLPNDPRPPLKAPKVTSPAKEYDPEYTPSGPAYDPTQQATPPRSPSLSNLSLSNLSVPSIQLPSQNHDSLADYDDPTPRSKMSTPTNPPYN
jgi:hypothetical protein